MNTDKLETSVEIEEFIRKAYLQLKARERKRKEVSRESKKEKAKKYIKKAERKLRNHHF